jgi:hypothetical protein
LSKIWPRVYLGFRFAKCGWVKILAPLLVLGRLVMTVLILLVALADQPIENCCRVDAAAGDQVWRMLAKKVRDNTVWVITRFLLRRGCIGVWGSCPKRISK